MRSFTKTDITLLSEEDQATQPQAMCTENLEKFGHVIFEAGYPGSLKVLEF